VADARAECCAEVVSQAVKISIIACETEVAVGPDGEGGSLVGRVCAGEFGRGVADERQYRRRDIGAGCGDQVDVHLAVRRGYCASAVRSKRSTSVGPVSFPAYSSRV
jgi:hypothetical protein